LDHFVSLPSNILKSVPLYLIWKNVFGWYDERVTYFPLMALAAGALWFLFRNPTLRMSALIIFFFNPYFTPYLLQGRTDIVFLSFILASLACLRHKYMQSSLIFMALAVTNKHTAWFIAPFYGTYLVATGYLKPKTLQRLLPSVVLIIAIVLPFLIWDFGAFIDDIFGYPAGSLPTSYPINGFGLSIILHKLKIIASKADPFPPFWIYLLLLPWMAWLVYDTFRKPTISRIVLSYGALLWPFWFLSRFFHDNYIGVVITIFALCTLLVYDEKDGSVSTQSSQQDTQLLSSKSALRRALLRLRPVSNRWCDAEIPRTDAA
jgi:hypothetical protein